MYKKSYPFLYSDYTMKIDFLSSLYVGGYIENPTTAGVHTDF